LVEQVALLAALPSVMDVVRVHIGEFGVAKACLSFFSNLSVNEETLLPLMAALPSIQAIGVRYVAILIMVLCQCERKSQSRRGVVKLTPTYPHIPQYITAITSESCFGGLNHMYGALPR
jgi:hypothetical protein